MSGKNELFHVNNLTDRIDRPLLYFVLIQEHFGRLFELLVAQLSLLIKLIER